MMKVIKESIAKKDIKNLTELLNIDIGVSKEDVFRHKDSIAKIFDYQTSRDKGEYYTNEQYAVIGSEYIANIEGVEKYNIWDVACGTGNLEKVLKCDKDKLWMSTLLKIDVDSVNRHIELSNPCFELDFLNGIDMFGIEGFSNKLPEKLRMKLEAREPFVFYMNPPYALVKSEDTDIGCCMARSGLKAAATNLYLQMLYRILSLTEYYKLERVYICVFSPSAFLYGKRYRAFLNVMEEKYCFNKGYILSKGRFADVNDTRDMSISFTAWERGYGKGIKKELVQYGTDNVIKVDDRERLQDWIKPKNVVERVNRPCVSSAYKLKGYKNTSVDALGQIMSDNYVTKGVNANAISTVPCVNGIDITFENLDRVLVSHAVRGAYYNKDLRKDKGSMIFHVPEVKNEVIWGEWVADSIVYAMFNKCNINIAYRDLDTSDGLVSTNNFLFPLKKSTVKEMGIVDKAVLVDLEEFEGNNGIILDMFEEYKSHLSSTGWDLYNLGVEFIVWTLTSGIRERAEYVMDTMAWDACIRQLMRCARVGCSTEKAKYMEDAFSRHRDFLVGRVAGLGVL